MANVINGGAHSDNPIDFQEFMIMPLGLPTFSEALRAVAETFHALKIGVEEERHSTAVGDEGGFAPKLTASRRRWTIIAGHQEGRLQAGQGCHLTLDPAASEFYRGNAKYTFKKAPARRAPATDMVDFFAELVAKYPIVSIEDGCGENDWRRWKKLTDKLGDKVQLVGDDMFVTNVKFLHKGIEKGIANSILVKVNQIGTLTETLDAVETGQQAATPP